MTPSSLFAVLSLIAAPAVLTNASSVLALNTANRFGRVIDRSRVLAAELRTLAQGDPLRAVRRRQLERLRLRAVLLMQAQSGIYAAIGAFVASALFAVLGAALDSSSVAGWAWLVGGVAFAFGAVATFALLLGCVLIVRETRVALLGLRDDVSPFGEHLDPPSGSEGGAKEGADPVRAEGSASPPAG